jgi:nicotinamidase/pyrazinamidase
VSRALVVVDYQNDFASPGGALSVSGGDAIAGRINELMRSGDYDLVVATRDWHPPDHGSFTDQGGIWPVHCVQDSEGAELHPDLDAAAVDVIVDKGQDRDTEGYSGFDGTALGELLRERGIDQVTVVGLATDYCVKHTALEALQEGFTVTVDTTAVRGVDVEPGDSDRALAELRAAGAVLA